MDLFSRLVKPKGFAWAYFWKLFAKFAKGGPRKSLFLSGKSTIRTVSNVQTSGVLQ